eukprot:6195011-Pleurochrysis_carterae.AAC.4
MEPSSSQQLHAGSVHAESKTHLTQKTIDARPTDMDALPPSRHIVCNAAKLKHEGCRVHVVVNGRRVSVLRTDSGLHCMDSLCYHGAGPLTSGDIEEVNGRECIVCPWYIWCLLIYSFAPAIVVSALPMRRSIPRLACTCCRHGYKVTLDTGEKLYRSTVFIDGKLQKAGWQSVGSRQRVHLAYEEDGQVVVELNLTDVQVESDKYAYRDRDV